jgi:hypothetical protein
MAKPKEGFHDLFAQVPEELWQALSDEANREQRSVTGQLIYILRQRYPDVSKEPPAAQPRRRPGRPPKRR